MNGRYGSAGLDPQRVAILRVPNAQSGAGRRGSGYLVCASTVLTAEHVIRDADAVEVRFNPDRPDEWVTEGNVVWSDPVIDAAVIVITPRPRDKRQVVPAQFGRVVERDVELDSSAMGFPRYKLRYDQAPPRGGRRSQYRDSAHAIGKIAVLANRREGTLEVLVAPPDRDPDPQRSPWEGMSGAAVWSGGRIIGLVAEHHRSDGLNRLAAVRVDHWYERLAAEQLEKLCSLLPQLPDRLDGLVDVAERSGEPTRVRDVAGLALSSDVQDVYHRVFTDAPVHIGPPVSWTLTELADLRREVTAAAQGASEVADTLTALCEALETKPVFITIGGRSLELDQLQVTYRREIEAWPGGGSADALLVEAASAGIVERRDKPGRSLGCLARFVVGIAARLGVAPDEDDSLREWIGSLGHQLADAQQHYLERREDPAWLLIDLGDEPLPGQASWPTKVMWTRVAPDGLLTGDPIICQPNQDDLKRALSEVLRLAPPARPLLVDLAVPRALMDLGIEHWEVVEVDGVAEPLSVDYRPRLRWSKRRHDERLFNRVCTRLENASWKGGPKQWLENDPHQACFVGWADVRPSPADPLRTVLRDGCAFVIWFRAGLPDSALREITKAVRKMPVQARRRNLPDFLPAFSQDHPVIIWDDPRGRGDFHLPPIVKPQSP
jgi:hypothetical protein